MTCFAARITDKVCVIGLVAGIHHPIAAGKGVYLSQLNLGCKKPVDRCYAYGSCLCSKILRAKKTLQRSNTLIKFCLLFCQSHASKNSAAYKRLLIINISKAY